MTLDIKRSGYDNLFLVGGYDWHAKMTDVSPLGVDDKARVLCANFEKLDKNDLVLVAKWENEVLHACGMKGKPLPVIVKAEVKTVQVSAATSTEAPKAPKSVKA